MDSKTGGYEQERLNILRMVEEGKISASEAASLLSAMTQEASPLSQTISHDFNAPLLQRLRKFRTSDGEATV